MALLVENPVDGLFGRPRWVLLDLGLGLQILRYELTKMISIISRVCHHVADTAKPCNEVPCLRTIAPLAGCDCEPDR